VVRALSAGTFDTAAGRVRFENNILRSGWMVGQWQDGAFRAVAPKFDGAAPVVMKPVWKT
jgi:branched-chain amino acid transport system substrate-binding protein